MVDIRNETENRSFSAVVFTDSTPTVTLNASYTTGGRLSFGETFNDVEAYKEYRKAVDAQIEAWKQKVTNTVIG